MSLSGDSTDGDAAMPECSDNSRLAALSRRLHRVYPQAEPPVVVQAVVHAHRGLQAIGLDDDDQAADLLATIAERELRLRLNLDGDDARLDPESHRRPS